MRTPASLAPFRHRSFALFWSGAFVSNIGTWMETVAIGYYVVELTNQAAWSGLIAAAGFVPTAVLGPFGGAIADRWPRRRVLVSTTLAQALLATLLTLLVATGEPAPGIVALVILASGCAAAIGFPAYQSTIPDLVPPEDLVAAIGLGSAQWNLGRIVGPAVAGLVITTLGVPWALGINAASFLAVVAVVLAITLPPPAAGARDEAMLSAIRTGWTYVRRDAGLRISFSVMCLNTFLAAPFIALIPAMAVKVLGGGEATTSLLVTAQGVGAVVAALSLGTLTAHHGIRRVLTGSVTLLPMALVLYGAAPGTALVALALVAVGGLYLAALSSFTTVAQQRAPAALRGRVLSVNMVVLGTLYPLGALIQGRVADSIGLRQTTIAAALVMLSVIVLVRVARPGYTAPLDEPVAVPSG